MRLQILNSIPANLVSAYEEAIFSSRINGLTSDVISIWKHPRSIYVTNNASILYFNKPYADKLSFPTTRSAMFAGKDTSILTLGGTWSVAIAVGKEIAESLEVFGNLFYFDLWGYVSKELGLELERKNNDLVVPKTDRKVLGCIYSEVKDCYIGNNVFSVSKPEQIDLNELYKLPDEKYANKMVTDADSRISSIFTETGKLATDNEIVELIKKYIDNIGIKCEIENGLSEIESDQLEKITEKHKSEEWIKYADLPRNQ